ncbi:zinc finger protein 521-like isoform X2 [Stegodyphus dumicola]|nr:zinc finger protein 521-like isoform X2 [Stegodyphus dumicola]XP_035205142.1 zinc finger protein 521-like isoform X2 [Stegodyphus dumicola]XP_035205148.1 zinc finger protein 521-like isoform X2 [Stegodyphus dumicola]
MMEKTKQDTSVRSKHYNFIGRTEKICRKCGFATFCLRVLYKHKYKCQGELLGPSIICCYCKRKFSFYSLLWKHKKACVKCNRKKAKHIRQKQHKRKLRNTKKSPNRFKKESSVVCPTCLQKFSSLLQYNLHAPNGLCTLKSFQKKYHSARKTIIKSRNNTWGMRTSTKQLPNNFIFRDEINSFFKQKREKYIASGFKDSQLDFMCLSCKNLYPTKKLLLKHLEKNKICAKAHYENPAFVTHTKVSFTARKTLTPVLARKSFPHSYRSKFYTSIAPKHSERSARKTLNHSLKKSRGKLRTSADIDIINQCPVCYEEFSDSFDFFQHQKKLNHWGKAAKSVSVNCKCPFCEKEFFHVRARNAHLRNHADRSEDDIELFLKNSTCNICSQIFVSELVKQQHVKIEHPSQMFNSAVKYQSSLDQSNVNTSCSSSDYSSRKENYSDKTKYSSIPLAVKVKLTQYPTVCPICMKDYTSTLTRNKHFIESHLKSSLECKFCPTSFSKSDSMVRHMQQCHNNYLEYECRECKIGFTTSLLVLQHALKSHPHSDPNSYVQIRNINPSVIQDQVLGLANDRKREELEKFSNSELQQKNLEYYCDTCKICFQKLCGLQRHRQSKLHRDTLEKSLDAVHQSLSNLPPSLPPFPKSTEQPEILCCSECLEEFTTIKDFVPHRLSHFSFRRKYLDISDTNPYSCEICGDVIDNHSKVQMHLFWHLQIDSSSEKNTSITTAGKNDPIKPDRLTGQQIAKKSFSKKGQDFQQEVVIGGVKKPLFTCENCNVGFTTQSHYNVHVRKFCKMRSSTEVKMDTGSEINNEPMKEHNSALDIKSNEKELEKPLEFFENESSVHCSDCNCLFALDAYKIHQSSCKKYTYNYSNAEYKQNNVDLVKSAIELQCAIAGCIACGLPFVKLDAYFEHMLEHLETSVQDCSSVSEASNIDEQNFIQRETIHCFLCNCLFRSIDVFQRHKDFCSVNVYNCNTEDTSSNINDIKCALKDKTAEAGCITCNLPFNNLQQIFDHMEMHHKLSQNSKTTLNGPVNDISGKNECCESSNVNHSAIDIINDVSQDCSTFPDKLFSVKELNMAAKSLDFTNNVIISSFSDIINKTEITEENNSSIFMSNVKKDEGLENSIDLLRKNFSSLLCILISDPELMQRLGYGEQLVDDVLINVLQQMGQTPILDDGKISDLDRLRKNIQILLDFCLKDQVMELIASGKTSTDDIVVEALKMFGGDESSTSIKAN